MPVHVALLGDERQAREVAGVADGRRVDVVLGEERAVGGHVPRAVAEEGERALGGVSGRAQPLVEGLAVKRIERGEVALATGLVDHGADDSAGP